MRLSQDTPEQEIDFSLALSPSLPLTPASLLWKDQKLLNFSSHDYLGLSQHPQMRKNAIKYVLHYGTGICHPEIVNGYLECQKQIEENYAKALGVAQVHLFATHSFALSVLLEQLIDCPTTLFIDAASQIPLKKYNAHIHTFPHGDLDTLHTQLCHTSTEKRIILSESLFATTGHTADLERLIPLAKKHAALLIIDDSYAFGVKGREGFGLAQRHPEIDFILCGLDAGAGANGAFIASSEKIDKQITLFREQTLTFSALGAIESALELIPTFEGERKQLEQRTHWIREQLKSRGAPLFPSTSHLIALRCPSKETGYQFWKHLLQLHILSTIHHIEQQTYLLFAINTHHNLEELSLLAHSCNAVWNP